MDCPICYHDLSRARPGNVVRPCTNDACPARIHTACLKTFYRHHRTYTCELCEGHGPEPPDCTAWWLPRLFILFGVLASWSIITVGSLEHISSFYWMVFVARMTWIGAFYFLLPCLCVWGIWTWV